MATAIKSVGLFRREELKPEQGIPESLWLFEPVSTEFAEAEYCPLSLDIAPV